MASPTPNLLTLPREIRNKIYSHLYQAVTVLWACKGRARSNNHNEDENNLFEMVELQIDNLPLLAVLLTHSRLHAEYLESQPFHNLHITVRLKIPVFSQSSRHRMFPSSNDLLQKQAEHILARARHVTLFVTAPTLRFYGRSSPWSLIQNFAVALASAVGESLASFRLALYQRGETCNGGDLSSKHSAIQSYAQETILGVPETLAGLSLACHAEGQGIESAKREVYGAATQDLENFCYWQKTIGLFAWCRRHTVRRRWDEMEILHEWPASVTPCDMLERVSPGSLEKMAKCPLGLLEWRQINGKPMRRI